MIYLSFSVCHERFRYRFVLRGKSGFYAASHGNSPLLRIKVAVHGKFYTEIFAFWSLSVGVMAFSRLIYNLVSCEGAFPRVELPIIGLTVGSCCFFPIYVSHKNFVYKYYPSSFFPCWRVICDFAFSSALSRGDKILLWGRKCSSIFCNLSTELPQDVQGTFSLQSIKLTFAALQKGYHYVEERSISIKMAQFNFNNGPFVLVARNPRLRTFHGYSVVIYLYMKHFNYSHYSCL